MAGQFLVDTQLLSIPLISCCREELSKPLNTRVLFEALKKRFGRNRKTKFDCSFKLVVSFQEDNSKNQEGKITKSVLKDKLRFDGNLAEEFGAVSKVRLMKLKEYHVTKSRSIA